MALITTKKKVLQIVQGSTSTETRNSTNTLADTTLTAAITPISSSNKVLVLLNQAGCDKSSANAGNQMILKLLRGASVIATFANNAGYTNSTLTLSFGSVGCIYLDSPSTTSATTYKTQLSSGDNQNTFTYDRVNLPSAVFHKHTVQSASVSTGSHYERYILP